MLFPFFKKSIPFGKRFLFVLMMIFTGNLSLFAQDLLMPVGARCAGMGSCSVALTGFWNINSNLAGMALVKDFSAGINYNEKFGMNELSTKSIAVLFPAHWGALGVSMDYFGYSLYHEMKFGLAYARAIDTHFRVGLKLDYFQTAFGDHYGDANNLTLEFGFQYDVSKNLTLGGYVFNPVPKSNSSDVYFKLPFIYRFGLSFHFTKDLLVSVEAEKDSDLPFFQLRAGVEYAINNQFFFRTGLTTHQEIFTTGFGYRLKGLSFDIAAVVHEMLGISPQISLIYSFGS